MVGEWTGQEEVSLSPSEVFLMTGKECMNQITVDPYGGPFVSKFKWNKSKYDSRSTKISFKMHKLLFKMFIQDM